MGMSGARNLKAWAALLMAALAASVLMAVVLASPAQAAPFSVTNTADSGEGSLRQAISDADAGAGEDTINFDPSLSGQTITLGSQLAVADSAGLIIDGGSANITVSGNNAVRVFEVRSGAKLTLNNLTVANGRGAAGGGIANLGTLTVTNSTLSGNSAYYGGGGGIWNNGGTVTVTNSTLSGNSSTWHGGGIYNWNGGTLTVINSTLSGNSVTDLDYASGGGIASYGGTLTVTNSTLSGNSAGAGRGGGIESYGGSATLNNTIVANSPSGGNCSVTITNGGYNLDSDGSCGFGTANNSISGTTDKPLDPQLGSLANNGGPTKTHTLLEDSPAIDEGSSFSATIDQRGLPRPSNFVGIVNADDGSDIGAFESQAPPDTTAPKVSAATPTGTGIGRGTSVAATFSEKISPASITKSTFKLFKVTSSGTTQVTNVTVTLSSDGLKATLNPFGTSTALLAARTKYKAVVTTGAKDLAGNALDQNSTTAGNQQKTWTFTTKG